MFMKVHKLASCLLIAGIALGTASISLAQERGGPAAKADVTGTFKSADSKAGTITITVTMSGGRGEERREPTTSEKTLHLAKNVEVAAGNAGVSGRVDRGAAGVGVNLAALPREAKLSDLAAGVKVTLYLSSDQKTVEGIVAEGPIVHGTLKSVDAGKKTLTVQMPAGRGPGRDGGVVPGEEQTYSVAEGAEIAVDDGRGSRFSVKEAKLADIAQGATVTVRLWVDMKKAQSVFAEGPSHQGTIKAIDPAKRTLTLAVRPGADAAEEYALTISNEAVIVVDNGKGKPLSVKLGKLSDIPVGAFASVKLSVDQVHIMSIRAEGPSLSGHLKSVDADKGTIVLSIPKGRDDADEKTLSVAKDVHIIIDGHAAKLADLKPGDTTNVVLRLTLDQQAVQTITSHNAMGR
jgi:hypothetical protein